LKKRDNQSEAYCEAAEKVREYRPKLLKELKTVFVNL
jgi:hypothetical protein